MVDCVPDEIEKYHLADLKVDVANANAKLRDHLGRVAVEHQRVREQQERERASLDSLKGRLNFD